MAVALVQSPSRACSAPQLSINTQRREELAIKQSRQLIPVTPSMPKGSVPNSVDKSKTKPALRTSEVNIALKSGLQHPSFIHNGKQSHSGHVKSDMPKASGKLLVLKPGWENGVSSPTQKDTASPTAIANSRVITSQHAIAHVSSASARNSNNSKLSTGERKAAALNPIAGFTVEKRPSLAQTQSRNDFFNLLKKKTSSNSSAGSSDSDPHISSSPTEKSEVTKEVVGAFVTAHANEHAIASTSNHLPTTHDGYILTSITAIRLFSLNAELKTAIDQNWKFQEQVPLFASAIVAGKQPPELEILGIITFISIAAGDLGGDRVRRIRQSCCSSSLVPCN
ncbi:uncharacterized protein LOC120217019 [Hibiscus syriacus]|uniref:uncharacterized protein LOC120217019 n=1 Tax=Hibiscus syriacus TaxID=106335 RepID=UPI0019220148|nr:uncharacterized protein LOC120217019 [Hibiscus syriacus]